MLSPQAMSALGQICEAEIISGVMQLDKGLSGTIYATGKKNGQTWEIRVEWKNGIPHRIELSNPQLEM